MPIYIKKPVFVEARLFDPGVDHDEALTVCKWANGTPNENGCTIPTLEGDHLARPGDYVILGIKGEFYPCKPDIFEATYEFAGDIISIGKGGRAGEEGES